MISSLSTLADRYFVVGFLLPVILATVAFLVLFQDIGPIGSVLDSATNADDFGKLTMLILGMWTAAVFLSIFNVALYQVLEGYTAPLNTAARSNAMAAVYRDRLAAVTALYEAAAKDTAGKPSWGAYYAANRQLDEDFPPVDALLPTRFGNVVRAAEAYSLKVYGVDSIKAWLRLTSVVPESFQNTINGARAEVDFFVNACFLSIALTVLAAVALLATLLLATPPFDAVGLIRLFAVPAGWLLASAAYEAAIGRARAWGHIVRSTFDLYLPALAGQLGYRLPDDPEKRRAFWTAVSVLFIDAIEMDPRQWPKKDSEGGRATADARQHVNVGTVLRALWRGR